MSKSENSAELARLAEAMREHVALERAFGLAETLRRRPSRRESRLAALRRLEKSLAGCRVCEIAQQRNKLVFGEGNPEAELMFVGEAPGQDEDRQGRPFVGRAGQLLTRIIEAMKLRRENVYIANVLKCRPPNNRAPQPDEMAACAPNLYKQSEIIQPRVIVALGLVAARALLHTERNMSAIRGRFFDCRGCKLLPTYHPAYLLRNPAAKRDVWQDMQKVMQALAVPDANKEIV